MVRFPNPRSAHPFHMHDMILGEPAFVAETLEHTKRANLDHFLGRARELIITGCGTSFHAAMYGAEVLQEAAGSARVVRAVHAYDLAFGVPPRRGSTVLGVSHSGSTPTTNRALRRARRAGCRTIGMCGLPDSDMEGETTQTWVIGSVHDHSWANTMSYTTQLTAFASIAANVAGPRWAGVQPGLRQLPRTLRTALRSEKVVRRLAKRAAERDRVTFLGSDLDAVTALEAALKIRETCSLPASGYHTEQFLHGPCLSIDRRESVVMLRSRVDGPRCEAIRRSMSRMGAPVTTIGDAAGADIRLPAVPRILRPIVSVVPLQFLAYYAALERHANPDIMRTDIPRYRAGLEPLFR
ncbi:MAG TPA: SIS domain-containing protein [Thermoplasmata archaeon]|nr:SIS domain-containing protein [Thermoplasmata archaeon]